MLGHKAFIYETIQIIQNWNANALYPRCMMNEMSVGETVIHYGHPEDGCEHDDEEDWVVTKVRGEGVSCSLGEKMWLQQINNRLSTLASLEREHLYPDREDQNPTRVTVTDKRHNKCPVKVGSYIVNGRQLHGEWIQTTPACSWHGLSGH